MPDAPMVFTLLTGNLRRGRPVDEFRAATQLAVYSEGMCPAGACSRTTDGIYQNRTLLGKTPLHTTVQRATNAKVVVRLAGYADYTLTFHPDKPLKDTANLSKLAPPKPKHDAAEDRNKSVNPFGN